MSISDTIGQVAASNPLVGIAVATSQTNSGILASLQTGDTSLGSLVGAESTQAMQVNTLLSRLEPNLGQNVDLRA